MKSAKTRDCVKKTTKRYNKVSRGAPPYSGTACCGKERKGNDGRMYVSKKASDGACRWHSMKPRSMSKK